MQELASIRGRTEAGALSDVIPERDFEAFYLSHHGRVYRAAFQLLGDPAEAEDVTQEAFLQAHRKPEALLQADRAAAWLFRVVTNLALNRLRSRRRQRLREQAAAVSENSATAEGDDPSALALRQEERQQVRCSLARLPERQSTLLLLRYAGLSYAELAEALQVAPGSVGTLLARAEAAFRLVHVHSPGGEG